MKKILTLCLLLFSSSLLFAESDEFRKAKEQGIVFSKDNRRLIKCNNKKLKSLKIPDGVMIICKSAFEECRSLTSITIPNSVTEIGAGAFGACTSLTSITIPNSVTAIGESAFRWCKSLRSITIPNSVTKIGYYAFSGCAKLEIIIIPESLYEKYKDYLPHRCRVELI